MSYSFEYIDIILLAMIAGFIFLRLRGILGKKTGFEGKISSQFEKEFQKTNIIPKPASENFDEVGKPNLANLVNYLFRVGDVNAQRYTAGNGGYPYWHSEVYPQLQHNDALHRVLLFMYYLNDVEEGGETEFYYQNRAVKPKAGRMVIAPAYFTHTHRGQIPKSNDKYILTSWLLFNRAEQIYTQG